MPYFLYRILREMGYFEAQAMKDMIARGVKIDPDNPIYKKEWVGDELHITWNTLTPKFIEITANSSLPPASDAPALA